MVFSCIFVYFIGLTFTLLSLNISAVRNLYVIKEETEMKTVTISLNSIDKVKSFVNEITKFDYDFDLVRADTLSMLSQLWVFSA